MCVTLIPEGGWIITKVYWHSYSNIPATRSQTASQPLAASLGNRKPQIQHLGGLYSMVSVFKQGRIRQAMYYECNVLAHSLTTVAVEKQ
jgi:hypothetical protein